LEVLARKIFTSLHIALIGFGLDSIVESLSGLALIWRLMKHKTISEDEEERIVVKLLSLFGDNLQYEITKGVCFQLVICKRVSCREP